MADSKAVQAPGSKFTKILDAAAQLPAVRIDRAAYLRGALKRYCSEEQIEEAISSSPAAAGISMKAITAAANTSIKFRCRPERPPQLRRSPLCGRDGKPSALLSAALAIPILTTTPYRPDCPANKDPDY